MTQDDYISWKNWIPMSGGCATAQARKDRCACTHTRGLDGWWGVPTRPKSFGVLIFWCFFVSRTLQSWDKCVFRMSEWKWPKEWNERVHKFCSSVLIFAGTANFFFPTWRGVPGAYTDKRHTVTHTWNTLKKCLFWLKEAERGWKSGATPLSWKRGWKPSTKREFWAQRSPGSFFRFRDMAVWSWFSCAIKFYIVIFRLCSSALYSTWYSRGLTAVIHKWCFKFILFCC